MTPQQKIKNFIDRHDKLVHWLTCVAIGLFILWLTRSIYWSIAAIVVAGFGKELYDKFVKKTFFDWWDIVADLAAIPIVLLIYFLFY